MPTGTATAAGVTAATGVGTLALEISKALAKGPPDDTYTNNYLVSMRHPTDVLFFDKTFKEDFQFLQVLTKTENIESDKYMITYIHAYDLWNDTTGGLVKLTGGGVGQQYANLKLQSQKGRGYSFRVIAYGRKL